MPSTYSPSLRIELIANGEQSGTWGTTTNNNLGTLIEQAISGVDTVNITAVNQALSASNGAADQSRNMVINLAGGTANFNLFVPPVEKLYVFRNTTAFTATIYCSTVLGNTTAAGAGIALPAGETTIVFTDGANVRTAMDYMPTALEVRSGGTGRTSATAFALLAGGTTADAPQQSVGTGTAGQVLVSGGASALPSFQTLNVQPFVAGTRLLFQQTAAPTGWTKDATHDNKALRVVSGTASSGGSVAFTTAFASQAVAGTVGSTTLTTTQIPSHTHSVNQPGGGVGVAQKGSTLTIGSTATSTGATGGGGSHNHTFTGTAINLAVQYVDVIIATKD